MHKCQAKYKGKQTCSRKFGLGTPWGNISFPRRAQWGPLLNHSFNQQNKHLWADIWLQGTITNANTCCAMAMAQPQSGIHFAVLKPPPLNEERGRIHNLTDQWRDKFPTRLIKEVLFSTLIKSIIPSYCREDTAHGKVYKRKYFIVYIICFIDTR